MMDESMIGSDIFRDMLHYSMLAPGLTWIVKIRNPFNQIFSSVSGSTFIWGCGMLLWLVFVLSDYANDTC
jgi:hypothetical protein